MGLGAKARCARRRARRARNQSTISAGSPRRASSADADQRGGGASPSRDRITSAVGLSAASLSRTAAPVVGRSEIGLGQEQAIGDRDLLDGFRMGVERRKAVDGVDGGEHAVDAIGGRQPRLGHQRVQDRRGIGKPRRLDHDAPEVRQFAAPLRGRRDATTSRPDRRARCSRYSRCRAARSAPRWSRSADGRGRSRRIR